MSSSRPAPALITVDPPDWEEAIAHIEGAQLVVGGPGTGKTEFLVRRVIHLLTVDDVPPEAIAVVGFSRRGVAEVRSRIRSGIDRSLGTLDIATFHSYAARLIESHWADAGWAENPQILTGPEQVSLVQELLSQEKPSAWSPGFAQLLGSQTFAREVTDFILRAGEHLHSPASLRSLERADWRGLPDFIATYDRELRARGRIDYGTLISTAVALLSGPAVQASSGPRFALVDEYQDTTPAQVRLLAALQQRGAHILAAADPYQSIYSFRGASVQNVAAFESTFGTPDRPATRILLSTSFRTPQVILDAAVAVTTGDLPGATGAVIPAPGKGGVETYLFDQQVEEAEWIAAETQRLHLVEQVPYGKIGIFVRSKRRLLADLSRALERRHIPHDLPGSRLTDQPAVRFLFDLAVAATGCDGSIASEQAIRRVLLGSRVRMTIGAYRALERTARRTGWIEAIESSLAEWAPLAALLDDCSWANEIAAEAGMWRVWSELPGIDAMVADPAASEERAAWRSLAQVLSRWGERNPAGTLLDYRELAMSEDFEAQPLLSYRRPHSDRLTLTTLHQAKGLDLDFVFLADAVDGVFPDLRTRDSLLGVRHLLPHVPTDAASYRAFRLQEESRLAYTAMTRARRRVIWTATERGLDDGPGRPSRFFSKLVETLAVTASRPAHEVAICEPFAGDDRSARPPVTTGEAEAALRRCVADVAAPAPRRLAALVTLSEGDRWALRPAQTFAGIARRGPDTGLVESDPVLSPSQAQSYELCPRRYALERRLKVGSDTSTHATFGTLIHDVLEGAERRAIERGASRSNLDDALTELDERFDPADYGGPPFAQSWAERAVAGLTKLYENWPAPGRSPAFLEHRLDAVIGGVRWTGRADRIDIGSGKTIVVDYKTSRTAAKVAEAAESLQLGFYVLAARQDDAVSALGDVAGAELWYPLTKPKKVTIRKFDMGRIDEVAERLNSIATGITAEDWAPNAGPHCERCSLRTLCPIWADGGPEFA